MNNQLGEKNMDLVKEQRFGECSTVVLFRHNDLDGVGCEIVLKSVFKDMCIRVYSCDYNSIDDCINEVIDNDLNYEHIIIADICPSHDVMQKLDSIQRKGVSIILFDHHKTSLKYNDFSWVLVSESKSVTLLMYEYYVKRHINLNRFVKEEIQNLDLFATTVHEYDTWSWVKIGNKEAVRLNDLFLSLGQRLFVEEILIKLSQKDMDLITRAESQLLHKFIWEKRHETFENASEELVFYKNKDGIRFGVIEDIGDFKENHSLFTHYLLDNYIMDFVIIGNKKDKRVSFRSDFFDVSKLAEKFGGGGHTLAAGCNYNDFFDNFDVKEFTL